MSTNLEVSSNASHFDIVIETLKTSGFYWGALTASQAKGLLQNKQVGTFLVRASSDPKHLFSVSLKTCTGVTNVRIVMSEGKFSLDHNNGTGNQRGCPKFDCVVKLMNYYTLLSRKPRQQNSPKKGLHGKGVHLFISTPLYKEVSSLQHLCRRTLNRLTIGEGVHRLPIPSKLKVYLKRYDYPV